MAQQAPVAITLRSLWLTSTHYEVMELSVGVSGSYLTAALFQRMTQESYGAGGTKPERYLARGWRAFSRRTAWTLGPSSGGPSATS
jgi:hypothetical protein